MTIFDFDKRNVLRRSFRWRESVSRFVALFLCALLFIPGMSAYNMRQTTNTDGLSNSAILSLCRDNDGYLWIGTCDGVNIADGIAVHPFASVFPGQSLSGNIIETILNGGGGNIWVLTNYGLDHVDLRTRKIVTFPQFHGQEVMCADKDGRLFVLAEDCTLYSYRAGSDKDFKSHGRLKHDFSAVRSVSIRGGKLWVVAADGIYIYDKGKLTTANKKVAVEPLRQLPLPSLFAKAHGEELFIVSPDGNLCEIDADGTSKIVKNIGNQLSERGKISDLVHDHQGNFFISFSTDGVIWVGLDERKEFISVDLGLQVGVFCLEQSSDQDVVWIGSDCQGVYTYWDDQYSIRSYDFNAFDKIISHPVRAIFIDGHRNMWLGTKGGGLLKIPGINEFYPRPALNKGELFTSANSPLLHNSVFGFGKSSRPLLWIATDEGLNYYNYREGKLYVAQTPPEVRFVHGVYEANDSVLWLCTLGRGVIKCRISGSAEHPVLTDFRIYRNDDGEVSSNHFFSMTPAQDGKMLFCNRGMGVFEIKDEKLSPIPLKGDFGTNVVNDVFDAISDKDVLWIGTGKGLIKSWNGKEKHFFGVENGFANNTIHEMVRDSDGEIWMSTNKGIVRFNPENDESETYGRNYGLNVTEFSDGAGFYTGNTIVFGGINGVTFINKHLTYTEPKPYLPKLSLLKMSVSGHDVPLEDYVEYDKGVTKITLGADQNHFSITVAAPDFINAYSYAYSYTLDGVNWINNGPGTTISFNEMRYGAYNLMVRYVNRATGAESDPCVVRIVIKAPWYLSGVAKAIYFVIFISLISFAVYLYLRRQKNKEAERMLRLEQAHREEVYEEKLKFFTNITHEFCTPLTLIYGPCERILSYPGSDDYIRKYVGLVRSNAERLNNLIQELIDFRRIETGNKVLKPSMVDVSELCNDIMTSFSELSERNNVDFVNEITPGIVWPSDFGCLRKIVTNLISNAFKYTHTGGTIRVGVRVAEERLEIRVFNTGKGIGDEDKERIFNRYSVLDNVEENAVKGLSNRNGLGMAICHSMVDMLGGQISIESEVGKFAEFVVVLPEIEAGGDFSVELRDTAGMGTQIVNHPAEDMGNIENPVAVSSKEKILVVDDNKEILRLLSDALSNYQVATAESADSALEFIRQTPPDLIVSDIMMPGTDGVTFTRMVKGNKHTMHIPLVLLSAKTSNEEKVEGIESGADAYIGKPFSIRYLKAVVKRLLESRSNLKEYYNTAAGAFEYKEGHLLHREDKEFIDEIVAYIGENIDDSDLSPEHLASHMNISVRNLYRKFKELDQLSPNDFIKAQRISFAARLLLTSSVTVQEVIYRSGFTNRSHFYKEFDKRFGMTPKDYRLANAKKDSSLDAADKG